MKISHLRRDNDDVMKRALVNTSDVNKPFSSEEGCKLRWALNFTNDYKITDRMKSDGRLADL